MNLEILQANNLQEAFSKFQISWFSSLSLTVLNALNWDAFMPVASQVVLFSVMQILAFGFDFLRLKVMGEKRKTTIKQENDRMQIESESEEKKQIDFDK